MLVILKSEIENKNSDIIRQSITFLIKIPELNFILIVFLNPTTFFPLFLLYLAR